jgi:hypothetical protein
MKNFTISSVSDYNLSNLPENDIIIKMIKPIDQVYEQLLYPIRITQNRRSGSYSYLLHPINYFLNSKKIETNQTIDEIIRGCKDYTMRIYTPDKLSKEIKFDISYEKLNFVITELKILMVKQLDGINYSLSPVSFYEIKNQFPNVHPVRSIFAAFDIKSSFENLHGSIDKYIIPSLTNLEGNDLKKIKKVLIVDPSTNKTIYEGE